MNQVTTNNISTIQNLETWQICMWE